MENRHFLSSVLTVTLIYGCSLILLLMALTSCLSGPSRSNQSDSSGNYSGSVSCRKCHERFYNLWASSHHGTAMQPITVNFVKTQVELNQDIINMEGASYKAVTKDTLLFIRELKGGVTLDYQVLWALGGKNVFYFLSNWEGGRLQTLPLAYDVKTKKWYNNPQSAIRHFPNMSPGGMQDSALSWRDRQYTFNTSCYGCHVSQLKNNFDLTTNTYQTNWKEAGINCETCHGPCAEHVRVCKEAGEGRIPKDLKIIITKTFTPEQHNSSCASCHAKMPPITASYLPGNRFYANIGFNSASSPRPDDPVFRYWTFTGAPLGAGAASGFRNNKFVNTNLLSTQANQLAMDLALIRYAELLLRHAECANEIGKPSEALDQLKLIRKRARIDIGADDRYGLATGVGIDYQIKYFGSMTNHVGISIYCP